MCSHSGFVSWPDKLLEGLLLMDPYSLLLDLCKMNDSKLTKEISPKVFYLFIYLFCHTTKEKNRKNGFNNGEETQRKL